METAAAFVTRATHAAADAVPNAVTKAIPGSGGVPLQKQEAPGVESEMTPRPEFIKDNYKGSGKLKGKVALITGGDSGIGRAVAVHFAREGAKGIAIVYKGGMEDADAVETVRLVEAEGSQCLAMSADIGLPEACQHAVDHTLKMYGQLDVLVNNAAEQHFRDSLDEVTPESLERVFATNVFSWFYLTQAAIPHMKPGASIINTTSVEAYVGDPHMLEYSVSKGCNLTFTRSLSQQLVEKGIRVNSVAPGPIWTPLIAATIPKDFQSTLQTMAPMKRPGQPSEVAPAYVFLASEDSSYFTGQTLHPNGGMPVAS